MSCNSLLEILENKLKERLKNIAFLELNRDLLLKKGLSIMNNMPVPIRTDSLITGIKNDMYSDDIPFEKIADAMIYVIGCDSEFKYSNNYIDILKKINNKIDEYIYNAAILFMQNKAYYDALIYLRALEKISDNHKQIRYDIANTLREMALDAKNKDRIDDYNLFYKISFFEFTRLSEQYPDFPYPHYYLGFYHFQEDKFDEALAEWKKAFSILEDDKIKDELERLIGGIEDKFIFEKGRNEIIEGSITEGLKKLLPLIEKYNTWSEVRYYIALGYRKLENYKKAEIHLTLLLDSGEEFSEIYNELGICYFSMGDIQKAIENLNKAVNLKEDCGYLCNLGIAYYKSGQIKKAKELINRAYTLNQGDEMTKQCKAWADKI